MLLHLCDASVTNARREIVQPRAEGREIGSSAGVLAKCCITEFCSATEWNNFPGQSVTEIHPEEGTMRVPLLYKVCE